MSAHTDLQALLLATPAVTALCGTRIYSDRAEQSAQTPFVVYVGTSEPQRALNGSVHGIKTVFDIQCWAASRSKANELAYAVQTAVDAQHMYASGPSSGFDADLDLEAAILECTWWA